VLTKFMNNLMRDGKKSVAESIVYGALDRVEGRGARSGGSVPRALDNVKPSVEVRSRRVGGATYQVPVEVRPSAAGAGDPLADHRRARKRNENTMVSACPASCWTPPTAAAPPSRSAKTRTRWQTPTRPSPLPLVTRIPARDSRVTLKSESHEG
jgi:hypothetical protein